MYFLKSDHRRSPSTPVRSQHPDSSDPPPTAPVHPRQLRSTPDSSGPPPTAPVHSRQLRSTPDSSGRCQIMGSDRI